MDKKALTSFGFMQDINAANNLPPPLVSTILAYKVKGLCQDLFGKTCFSIDEPQLRENFP